MATMIPTSPYAMNAATLTLGADDWTAAVTQAELQPQSGEDAHLKELQHDTQSSCNSLSRC